ncbi:MAG TPA: hypothetical protein VMI11_13035 [Actinomycetes bacterium]|nr:hypothetical protein [Actinomycetes bacterium]
MRDVDVEVLEFAGEQPPPGEGSSVRRHARLAAALAVVLLIGVALGGLAARGSEQQSRRAAAARELSLTAIVVPGGSDAHPEEATAVGTVDLVVVNAGPLALPRVDVGWDDVHQAFLPAGSAPVTLRDLSPGEAGRVELSLVQPCSTPTPAGAGQVPRLDVLARTPDGHQRRAVLDPLGLDAVWAELAAACPVDDPTTTTSVGLVGSSPLGPRGARLRLEFSNPASVDVLIRDVRVSRGTAVSTGQRPATLQVFPHFQADATVDLRIGDCRGALVADDPVQVRYTVASADSPNQRHEVTQVVPDVSFAVGQLVYRACSGR